MPQNRPCPGEFYRHFKNKMYQIIAIAADSETLEPMVVYQALYDDYKTYVRPYQMFISEVDHEKYPQVTQKYRFEQVMIEDGTVIAKSSQVTQTDQTTEAVRIIESAQTTERIQITESAQTTETVQARVSVQQDEMQYYDELTQVNPMLLRFLDEDDFDKKYEILTEMSGDISDSLIDNLAASLDVVIPEGQLEDRYQQLKICVRTRQRFETNRFR